jgi:hypothetical protein
MLDYSNPVGITYVQDKNQKNPYFWVVGLRPTTQK